MADAKVTIKQSQPHSSATTIIIAIAVALFLSIAAIFVHSYFFIPRIAYVDTNKLMIGFSEANRVEKELKAEDDKWRGQLKMIKDSVQASIDIMSKEFNTAKPDRRKELEDNLSAWNQRANNFRQANMEKMEKLKAEKIGTVYQKINVFMAEFGKRHHYGIVMGTLSGGNILYADERKFDITDRIIRGLNERYK
jgi:Skp family chaperone for outer membrane proteins